MRAPVSRLTRATSHRRGRSFHRHLWCAIDLPMPARRPPLGVRRRRRRRRRRCSSTPPPRSATSPWRPRARSSQRLSACCRAAASGSPPRRRRSAEEPVVARSQGTSTLAGRWRRLCVASRLVERCVLGARARCRARARVRYVCERRRVRTAGPIPAACWNRLLLHRLAAHATRMVGRWLHVIFSHLLSRSRRWWRRSRGGGVDLCCRPLGRRAVATTTDCRVGRRALGHTSNGSVDGALGSVRV